MKEQRPKLNRGEDPILKRLKATENRDVEALMRNTPTQQDELDEVLPGAVERAREREMPLDQRKKRRHERSRPEAVEETTDESLDALVDRLTPEQREHVHQRLIEHADRDEGWTFDFEEDESEEDDEAGDEL